MARRRSDPFESVDDALGDVLRSLRTTRGLSQEQLGFDLGSGRTYISEVERGVKSITVKWLFRLAAHLDVSPAELLQQVEAHLQGD